MFFLRKKKSRGALLIAGIIFVFSLSCSAAQQTQPQIEITPLSAVNLPVPYNQVEHVRYQVKNKDKHRLVLAYHPQAGIQQQIHGVGHCRQPMALNKGQSCILELEIKGPELTSPVTSGPKLCLTNQTKSCFQPAPAEQLSLSPQPAILEANLSLFVPLLSLSTLGPSDSFTIKNNSTNVIAFDIKSNFSGTALSGIVTESGNTCAQLFPGEQCQLTYTPGAVQVGATNFTIQGTNTSTITAAIEILNSVSVTGISPNSGPVTGSTGVTITGTAFTGATNVTIGGVAATSINVVNSTTITAVTPGNALGAADVEVTAPAGTNSLINGYTYVANAVGEPTGGGVIACLNGAPNFNFIAPVADQASDIWAPNNNATGAADPDDGLQNTLDIVAGVGNVGTYAALNCTNLEIDSQGNTPCQAGNTCYNDWFLPAENQAVCMNADFAAIGGFSLGPYWVSEDLGLNAFTIDIVAGAGAAFLRGTVQQIRCIREFTP